MQQFEIVPPSSLLCFCHLFLYLSLLLSSFLDGIVHVRRGRRDGGRRVSVCGPDIIRFVWEWAEEVGERVDCDEDREMI